MYIAHKAEGKEPQSVAEHSEETAEGCKAAAVEPWKDFLYEIGLTHDIGKYQPSFQLRINGANVKAPHALCGAKEWKNIYKSTAYSVLAQYVIAGHHTGLPDGGNKSDDAFEPSLFGTLRRECEDYSACRAELCMEKKDFSPLNEYMLKDCRTTEELAERFAFFTRYCFSCLTDADWLNTEKYCTGKERRPPTADFERCLASVKAVLDGFECKTRLQKTRASVQRQVFEKTKADGGVLLMNMPTGSGKTLAAVRFALERAIESDKRRIIFIIPYNSIIDQTASSLGKIFGDSAEILRHQSSFNLEPGEELSEETALRMKLATENWDAKIILTTAVQFFESVYSGRRSRLRKMHNMADSILIFDEAHLMPPEYLQPCLQAVAHITKFLGSQALFLTATMPDFPKLFRELSEQNVTITELVTDKSEFSACADTGGIGRVESGSRFAV